MTAFAWKTSEPFFLDIDGLRLEARAWGPPPSEAPTLLLLHEGLGCVALWRDFPQKLRTATGCGVLAYSRAGYGASDTVALPRPLDYMTREARETLPRVLDRLGLQEFVLIGHSDGASIAAIYAGRFADDRLAGQALIAPHFFAEASGLEAIAEAARAYREGDLKPKLAKYHSDVEAAFWGWNRAWLDPEFARWNIAEAIEGWRVPTLAVQGESDPYGTIAQIEEIQRRAVAPVETLWLPDCGHAPQFERAEPTLAAIADFCRRVVVAAPRDVTP